MVSQPHYFPPLGPYDLHEVIGRGGMGTVYLGVNRDTGMKVAVKVLAPVYADHPGFRERFEAEIQSLEKLNHPNIVQLYGYGEQQGTLFYAMELVHGSSLQRELTSGRRFTWREVTQIGIEICSALKHAHDHGIIHRDIKPANLLLTADEKQVKLTDFGIAKLFGNPQITVDGGILGTADYMAPEQAEGIGATARSDLYSLGGVLYCLLAGRPPFHGKSIAEVIHKVRYDTPQPIRQLAEETPEELELVIKQLLNKDPEARIPTARALSNRLKAIQHALSLHAQTLEGGIVLVNPAEAAPGPAAARGLSDEEFANLETVVEPEDDDQDRPDSLDGQAEGLPQGEREPAAPGAWPALMPDNPAAVKPSIKSSGQTIGRSRTRFTSVDDAHRRRRWLPEPDREESLWSKTAGVVCLLALLALLVAAVSYARRPPSADRMYAQIHSAASEGTEALLRTEGIVTSFLQRFPRDARTEEVSALFEEIELAQLERQLEITSRLRNASRYLAPVEQALVDAIRNETLNPITAARDLEAIIAVFSTDPDATEREKQCIRLARRNLSRLESRIERSAQTYVSVLQDRLEFAARLKESDAAEARRILWGIVQLYSNKPWAEGVVNQAQRLLEDDRDSSAAANAR